MTEKRMSNNFKSVKDTSGRWTVISGNGR